MMEMTDLWSSVLTLGIGFIGFVLRGYVIELSRLRILLNRTREEYVTKADSNQVLSQIMSKFDRIEEKLDRLVERK
jgi:tRNA(Phe) wybutosine-synthesizing methylase Tyw3